MPDAVHDRTAASWPQRSDCCRPHETLVPKIARKAGHTPLATFDKALARLDGARKL